LHAPPASGTSAQSPSDETFSAPSISRNEFASSGAFERLFYVVDAQLDWKLPHDAVQVCLAREVFTAFSPMKGEKRDRIIGTFPEGTSKEASEIVYEEIEEQIRQSFL
jgi:hypothetical protein